MAAAISRALAAGDAAARAAAAIVAPAQIPVYHAVDSYAVSSTPVAATVLRVGPAHPSTTPTLLPTAPARVSEGAAPTVDPRAVDGDEELEPDDVEGEDVKDEAKLTSDPHIDTSTPKGAIGGMAAVRQALTRIGLERYAQTFEVAGWDDVDFLLTLDEALLRNVASTCGMQPGHARKFVDVFGAWSRSRV